MADKYEQLFTKEDKVRAFDMLANRYYDHNFGTMQKADIDTLMFHFYIEQILARNEDDMAAYRDYVLANDLGITQSKVRSLKLRKQLQYQRPYDWKRAFLRVSENARYEGGKIIIAISDPNLLAKLRDVIEQAGGFSDIRSDAKLLRVSPEWYVELLLLACDDDDREKMKASLRETLKRTDDESEFLDKQSLPETIRCAFKESAAIAIGEFVGEVFSRSVPLVGPAVKGVLTHIAGEIAKKRKA